MVDSVIRAAIKADLPGLLELFRHLHPDDPVVDLAAAERVWSALLSSGLTTVIVADAGGMLVSSCTLAVVPNLTRGARPYGVIESGGGVWHLSPLGTAFAARGYPPSRV